MSPETFPLMQEVTSFIPVFYHCCMLNPYAVSGARPNSTRVQTGGHCQYCSHTMDDRHCCKSTAPCRIHGGVHRAGGLCSSVQLLTLQSLQK